MELLFLGFLASIAFFIVMVKIGIGKFTKYPWQSDLLISFVLAFIFVGTFTGMVTGLIAGILISLYLSVAKKWKERPAKKEEQVQVVWIDDRQSAYEHIFEK